MANLLVAVTLIGFVLSLPASTFAAEFSPNRQFSAFLEAPVPPLKGCCEPSDRTLHRQLKRMSLDLVKRETEGQGVVHVVDMFKNQDQIASDLEVHVGDLLRFSSNSHNHSVKYLVAQYGVHRGWPLASSFRLINHPSPYVCIIFPLSSAKSAMEFAARMMGDFNLPVVHETNEFVVRYLSAAHESYHCISSAVSELDQWNRTLLETIADVGAINEALKLGMDKQYLTALADWRALRFAAAIVNVVAGREDGKNIYYRASPSHLSTVAVTRLLERGGVDTYEELEKLALSSTAEGLFGEKKKAQSYLTRIFLLYKNTRLKQRFPNATLQDADEILSAIGAPRQIVIAVAKAIDNYWSKLNCRSVPYREEDAENTGLLCEQSDGSFLYANRALLGIADQNGTSVRKPFMMTARGEGAISVSPRKMFLQGQKISFPSHDQYHLDP